ncbi:MAG: hypothetical protein KF819_35985 [Labilithrix sp.]|nr:hypothetical protein [Labilithrix sp.]
MHSRSRIVFAALGLAACLTSAACAAPPIEEKGSRTEKLLAPRAVFRANASPATAKAVGVTEWRIHRGKSDYVLTGYDRDGDAVKGVSLAFLGKTGKKKAALRGRVLDGTRFAMRHEYQGATSKNGTMSKATKAFLDRAIADMGSLSQGLVTAYHDGSVPTFGPGYPGPGKGGTTPAPVPPPSPFPSPLPTDPTGGMGPACGADMTTAIMAALQCLMTSGGADPTALMACVQAAVAASSAGGTCPSGPMTDPMGGDPYGEDPYGPMGGPMGGPAGGPVGGPMGGPAGGPTDPYGDPYGQDPYGPGGPVDQAGGMGTCMSCPPGGGFDDIGADPMNGDVYGGPGDMGDFGAGY